MIKIIPCGLPFAWVFCTDHAEHCLCSPSAAVQHWLHLLFQQTECASLRYDPTRLQERVRERDLSKSLADNKQMTLGEGADVDEQICGPADLTA